MAKKSTPPRVPASPRESAMQDGQSGLVPKLRFPEFVDEPIRTVSLGEVTEECIGRRGKQLTSAAIMGVSKADGIVPMEERLIGKDTTRYKLLSPDWFAYNPMRINIGSIARWRGDCDVLVSPDYMVFRCVDDHESGISADYLDQFRSSRHWERFVTGNGDGGVRIRIYYKDLALLSMGLPSLPEQRKIASCLSTLDELIGAQGRKVAALRTHKKGLMQQLFPREGETQPRLRFPKFQDAGDWRDTTIGNVCRLKAGEFVPASDIKDEFQVGLYPCYGGNGLRGYVQSSTHEGLYVLIGRQGALCGNVNLIDGRFHATEHALVVTPNKEFATEWMFYALGDLNLNQFSIGQAQPGLSVGVLNNLPIAVPSNADEQQRIASCLSSLDELITAETQRLEALKTHKRGLMQQLFPSPEAT